MARLNKTEKLIRNAAKGKNTFEARVFNKLIDFYEKYDYLKNDINIAIINYLYCCNHKRETFDNIARSFYISVSALEENRREYQKMFSYLYQNMKLQESEAA